MDIDNAPSETSSALNEAPQQTGAPVIENKETFIDYQRAMKAFKESQAKKDQELSEYKTKLSKLDSLDQFAQKDDIFSILSHYGYDYEKLTNKILEGQDPHERRFKELESKIEADKKAREEEEKKKQDALLTERVQLFKNRIKEHVETNKDKYELVHHNQAYDDVFEIIKGVWEQQKIELTFDQAAQELEDHFERELEKIATLKKLQKRLTKSDEDFSHIPESQRDFVRKEVGKPNPPTLSKPSFVSSSQPSKPLESMNDDERMQLAKKQLRDAMGYKQ